MGAGKGKPKMARKYTAKELEGKINQYFSDIQENNSNPELEHIYPTIEGLQTFLNICPDTWDSYENYIPPDNYNTQDNISGEIIDRIETSRIIKKTSRKILGMLMQEGMRDPKKAAMVIYLSKQKAYGGYTDRQIVESSGDVAINLTIKGADGKDLKR